jgi:hypothetical protein
VDGIGWKETLNRALLPWEYLTTPPKAEDKALREWKEDWAFVIDVSRIEGIGES